MTTAAAETIETQGIVYNLIKISNVPGFVSRQILQLERPKGKTRYVAVRYENGSLSQVTKSPFQRSTNV